MNQENYTRIELKYCERCGGLWLRHAGTGQVYCAYCAADMAEVARGPKKQPLSVRWATGCGGAACA
jgi:hypothetical protein